MHKPVEFGEREVDSLHAAERIATRCGAGGAEQRDGVGLPDDGLPNARGGDGP